MSRWKEKLSAFLSPKGPPKCHLPFCWPLLSFSLLFTPLQPPWALVGSFSYTKHIPSPGPLYLLFLLPGLPRWLSGNLPNRSHGFDPQVGKAPWRREWATHSSILAWEIPWTESGGVQSMGSQRVRHDLVTNDNSNNWQEHPFSRSSPNWCLLLVFLPPAHPAGQDLCCDTWSFSSYSPWGLLLSWRTGLVALRRVES